MSISKPAPPRPTRGPRYRTGAPAVSRIAIAITPISGAKTARVEPAIARSNAVGVARHAPHPNAALLFYEYLLGEGQQYFVSMDYVPSNTKVTSSLKGIRIVQTNPARALDESEKWATLLQRTLLRH